MKLTHTKFSGGISPYSKSGVGNHCRASQNLSIYEDADSVTVTPKPTKVSGTTVIGLVKWIVEGSPWDTNRYAYDGSGNIYKITSAESWSVDRATATIGNGAAGQGLMVLADYLYYPTSTTLGRLGLLSGTPSYSDDFLSDGIINLDQFLDTSGNTYTLPTSINEGATHRQTFIPAKDPLKRVQVLVAAKGTGDWTVTVHNAANTAIGSKTIAAASMANGDVNFDFATPLRVVNGNTYHFHVTSTVADGTVTTTTTADLETVDFHTYFGILITDANYHPAIQHTNGATGIVVVGNANYLAVYDQASYDPNAIMLEAGFNVRALVKENEFVVALAWKGTTIDGSEEGRAYYWDGIQPYYNYSKPITGGLPNAAVNYKGKIFSILGSRGAMHINTEPFFKIQELPGLARGKKVEIYPGAIEVWQGRVMIGTGASDDASFRHGVYEFGSISDRTIGGDTAEVLNLGHIISTGSTQDTDTKIGCVKAFGKDFYISWLDADGTTYGVDKVTKTNSPATTLAFWEAPISDIGSDGKNLIRQPDSFKLGRRVVVTFAALPSTDISIKAKYKLERASTGGTDNDGWTDGTAVATATSTRAEVLLNGLAGARYKEIEYGFEITCSGSNFPTITSCYLEFDPLVKETETNL